MHRLNELVEKLSPAQVQQVEDFAAALVARSQVSGRKNQGIDVDGIVEIMSRLPADKSAVDLAHEATDARVEKYEQHLKRHG